MADIISEMDNMTDDEIRMQIALIDNVNISLAHKLEGCIKDRNRLLRQSQLIYHLTNDFLGVCSLV